MIQTKAHSDKINRLLYIDDLVITAGQDGWLKKWKVDVDEQIIELETELKLPEAILDLCMMESKLAVASGNGVTIVNLSNFKAE